MANNEKTKLDEAQDSYYSDDVESDEFDLSFLDDDSDDEKEEKLDESGK